MNFFHVDSFARYKSGLAVELRIVKIRCRARATQEGRVHHRKPVSCDARHRWRGMYSVSQERLGRQAAHGSVYELHHVDHRNRDAGGLETGVQLQETSGIT